VMPGLESNQGGAFLQQVCILVHYGRETKSALLGMLYIPLLLV